MKNADGGGMKVLFGETLSIIRHAEAAVVNSGTASLETVLLDTPQVVGYIGGKLSYAIAKRIIKVKYISLGNLIADRLAFRELIQGDCTADNLVSEIRALIGADSLAFLSVDGLSEIAPDARCGFCDGCFTGRYPLCVPEAGKNRAAPDAAGGSGCSGRL